MSWLSFGRNHISITYTRRVVKVKIGKNMQQPTFVARDES